MKKMLSTMFVCLLLVACLMMSCACAATLEPYHNFDAAAFGTGDTTVKAHFDALTAFDDQNQMTFTVVADDLYAAEDVKALQPGDTVILYGEELTVQSVDTNEDGVPVVFTTDNPDVGNEFYKYSSETPDVLYTSDCEIPMSTEMGEYTFPMADQMTLRTWFIEEDGSQSFELKTDIVPAGEVKAFFAARSDNEKEDYLNCSGEHVTIRVSDGKVTEIEVDWGADD